MNPGKFATSLESARSWLRRYGLLKHAQRRGAGLSNAFRAMLHSAGYVELYETATTNFDYDLLLEDDSLFQFSRIAERKLGEVALRYAFYQTPYDYPTYREFLEENGLEPTEVGDSFRDEFDQVLSESGLNAAAVAIRYDYSISGYRPGVHASSHIHVGINTSIRIPVHVCLTPESFVLFVVRHVYGRRWERLLANDDFRAIVESGKRQCPSLPPELIDQLDERQLFLT